MVWSSTEICKAFQRITCGVFAILTAADKGTTVEDLSERGKALTRAKEATEWRRLQQTQQSFCVAGSQPHSTSLMVIHDILENYESSRRVEEDDNPSGNDRVPVTPMANVLQVRPPRRTRCESEVLLRCGDLQLMNKIDDPVHLINCFKTGQ